MTSGSSLLTSRSPLLAEPSWQMPVRWTVPALAVLAALALVFLRMPLNILLICGLFAFVLGLTAPPSALGFLVATVPMQAVGEQHLGPLTLRFTSTVVGVVVVAWILGRCLTNDRIRVSWVALPFAGHVLALALSGVAAVDRRAWAAELYRWSVALIVLVIAVDVIRDQAAARPALIGMALGTTVVALYGFYQVATGVGPEAFNVGGLQRAYGTFGQPNPFAGYLELTVPLLAAIGASALIRWPGPLVQPWMVTLAIVAAGFGTIALILTQSRGGWAGATLGLGAVVWLTGGAARWVGLLGAAVLVLTLVASPLGKPLLARLSLPNGNAGAAVHVTPANFAEQERLAHWRAGIAMVRDKPLLGVGAGNFDRRFREYTTVWRFRVPRGHAHNAYIHAAAQAGFVGLSTYVALLSTVGWRLWVGLRTVRSGWNRPLVVGAIGVTIAFAVHNLFDYLHVLSFGVQLSVVWAIAEAAIRSQSPQPMSLGDGGR